MKQVFVFMAVLSMWLSACSQEKLLSMRIVYEVPIMQARVGSSQMSDSVVYDYLVDKRFWWQAIDFVNAAAKDKKLFFLNDKGDSLNYDTVMCGLATAFGKVYGITCTKEEVQRLIEEEVRVIKFEEQWFYNSESMLIEKKVLAFCPVIRKDTVALQGEELQTAEAFRFELGWIKPKGDVLSRDMLVLVRNIEFTMPIYNQQPYHWWDSHLEAEYSIPFLERLIVRTETGEVKAYENPSASEELLRTDVLKRRQFDILERLTASDTEGNVKERDTVIKALYGSENIDRFRFGEEWCFDKVNLNFIKRTNYFAPMVSIFGKQGDFRGLYPLYYIRRR